MKPLPMCRTARLAAGLGLAAALISSGGCTTVGKAAVGTVATVAKGTSGMVAGGSDDDDYP